MIPSCCTTCGRRFPKRKLAPPTELSAAELAALTDEALVAYRKKTAPLEDCRFALKYHLEMPPELRAQWAALVEAVPTLARAEVYRRLAALKAARARWQNARDDAAGLPWYVPPAVCRWRESAEAAA
jgi:hypothetical protein